MIWTVHKWDGIKVNYYKEKSTVKVFIIGEALCTKGNLQMIPLKAKGQFE